MKIEKINIKNFKGIDNYEGEINGSNVYLLGGNASGKTSFIDAIWGCLSPKNLPTEPVSKGEKKALVEIDLGDFIARSKFTRGKAVNFEIENKVFNSETEKFIKAPRTYLSNRIGIIDFDVHDFFSKTDAEKLKYLSKILDQDFSDLDADIEEAMESRKFDKKRLAELSATVDYYSKKDAEADLIDIVALSKEVNQEEKKVETYNKVKLGIQERRDKIAVLEKEILDGEKWMANESVIPDEEKIKALNEKLDSANETNKRIQSAKTAKLVDDEVEDLNKEISLATDDIERLRKEKAKRISDVINVEGLEYNVEKEIFLYNGLPFESNQINTAAQLIAGMHIASTMLKDLKIIRVDASLIDKNNFNKVLSWAKEKDIELFIEIVDREADVASLEIKVD